MFPRGKNQITFRTSLTLKSTVTWKILAVVKLVLNVIWNRRKVQASHWSNFRWIFIFLAASMANYLVIILTAVVKCKEIHNLHRFFVKQINTKEIQIRTTCTQKTQLSFMILVVAISLSVQIQNGVILTTRTFFVTFIYTNSMQYIVNVSLI